MSSYRLGTYRLPAAEVVLVRTLMRLYAHDASFPWTFADAPPYDALLADGTTAEGSGTEPERLARAVLRLTRLNGGGGPDTLERPLRADKLQAWLKRVEAGIHGTPGAGAPAEPAAASAAPERQARPEPAAAPASRGAAEAQAAPALDPTLAGVRLKLRRWPPATMLRNDPQRIRMATLLSRRPLQVEELASISGRPLDECQTFVRNLQAVGLVNVQASPPESSLAPQAGAEPAVAHHTHTPPRARFAAGLIGSIRKRLGL